MELPEEREEDWTGSSTSRSQPSYYLSAMKTRSISSYVPIVLLDPGVDTWDCTGAPRSQVTIRTRAILHVRQILWYDGSKSQKDTRHHRDAQIPEMDAEVGGVKDRSSMMERVYHEDQPTQEAVTSDSSC